MFITDGRCEFSSSVDDFCEKKKIEKIIGTILKYILILECQVAYKGHECIKYSVKNYEVYGWKMQDKTLLFDGTLFWLSLTRCIL